MPSDHPSMQNPVDKPLVKFTNKDNVSFFVAGQYYGRTLMPNGLDYMNHFMAVSPWPQHELKKVDAVLPQDEIFRSIRLVNPFLTAPVL